MLHPLARLRTAAGLSHPAYAHLVAQTHAALGLGQMAARREKVSRWESGRTEPEHSAQLAMAHIHHVPASEVGRLGWPDWLHLATGDTGLLDEPHTEEGAAHVLDSSLLLPRAPRPSGLLLGGRVLTRQVATALAHLAESSEGEAAETAVRDGAGAPSARLEWAETRIAALEQYEFGSLLPPAALYSAAVAEHRRLVALIAATPHSRPVPRTLFRLAARTGLLCCWIASALGEEARAERHAHAALRAAVAAGSRAHVSDAFTRLALRHLIAGEAADALTLLHGARAALPRTSPEAEVELHCQQALAQARLGDPGAAQRSLGSAAEAIARGTGASAMIAQQRSVAVSGALIWLFLGRHDTARRHFGPLTERLTAPQAGPPSPFTAQWLLYAVSTHLALGEVDVAADTARHALDVTGTLPPGMALQYHERLAAHGHEPLVRQVLERLHDEG